MWGVVKTINGLSDRRIFGACACEARTSLNPPASVVCEGGRRPFNYMLGRTAADTRCFEPAMQ